MYISGISSILTMIVPFAFVIIIVWLKNNEKQKQQQLQADLYAKLVEKGQPLPEGLFVKQKGSQKPLPPLNTGIILIAVGIGISLFFFLMGISFASVDQNVSNVLISVTSIGAIPFLIGVAFFIIHFIEKKKTIDENTK